MPLQLSNNAESILASALTDSATTLSVNAGEGARFPALAAGDWFPLHLLDVSDPTAYEIVRCTARSGDDFTIVRAQEGTTNIAFDAGDRVELRLTVAALDEFARSGLADLTVLRGLNFAVAGGNANAMTASIDGISTYSDNLMVRVRTPGANTTVSVTMNVNSLGAVPIKQKDNVDLEVGTIPANTVITLAYDNANGVFILANPAALDTPNADTSTYGLARQRDSSVVAYGGAGTGDDSDYVTEQAVNNVVADYDAANAVPKFPSKWRYYGDGTDGVETGDSGFLTPNREYEFTTYTINNGQIVEGKRNGATSNRAAGCIVIRAQTKVTINGQLILPDGQVPRLGDLFVGPAPLGSHTVAPGIDNAELLPSETQWLKTGADAAPVPDYAVYAAMRAGVPFHQFRGGCGRRDWTRGLLRGDEALTVGAYNGGNGARPCGGCVIVAPEIELGATAQIVLNSRENLEAGEPDENDSAGGMLILVCPAAGLTLNAGATYAAGKDPTDFETKTQWRVDRGLESGDTSGTAGRKCAAANGQMFSLDPDTGVLTTHF